MNLHPFTCLCQSCRTAPGHLGTMFYADGPNEAFVTMARHRNQDAYVEFAKTLKCPITGVVGACHANSITHFVVPCPENGRLPPLPEEGQPHKREIACQSILPLAERVPTQKSITGLASAVTCPGCLEVMAKGDAEVLKVLRPLVSDFVS